MAKKHLMTARRKAALRKAQLASARKRRKGRVRKKASQLRHSPRIRRNVRRTAKTAAVAAVVGAYGVAAYGDYKRESHKRKVAYANAKRMQAHYARVASMHSRPRPKKRKARVASGGPTKHNRIFVTTSRGTTSVRKRTH